MRLAKKYVLLVLKNTIGLHDWEILHALNLKFGKGFAKDLVGLTHKHVW